MANEFRIKNGFVIGTDSTYNNPINEISTDRNLGDSNTTLVVQSAVKGYVDDAINNIPTPTGSISKFIELLDTPNDYTGQSGKILTVSSGESGLEFVDAPTGTLQDLQSVTEQGNATTLDIIVGSSSGIYSMLTSGNGGAPGLLLSDGSQDASIVFDYTNSALSINHKLVGGSYITPTLSEEYIQKKYVDDSISGIPDVDLSWGNISGVLDNQTDLKNELDSKADINHTHTIPQVSGLQTALDGKENSLGNPTTDGNVLTSLIDGTRNWKKLVGGTNVIVNVDDPNNIVFSATSGTTAGILSRAYMTGDTEDVGGTTFYKLQTNKGTVDEVTQQVSITGATGAPQTEFLTSVIGLVHTEDYLIAKGSYNGQLTLATSSNTGDMRFVIKVFKASATDGSYDPVNDLIAEVDTGIIDFQRDNPTPLPFSAPVEQEWTITSNDRVVYVVSAGATAGNHTITWYLGNLHNNFLDVPIQSTTDNVINKSNVTGAMTSDALNQLQTDLGNKADKVSGATDGDLAALDSNGNLVDSGYVVDDTQTTTANLWSANKISSEIGNSGGGDMTKAIYDTDDSGIVDDSEKLGGNVPDYYATESGLLQHTSDSTIHFTQTDIDYNNLQNKPTIPSILDDLNDVSVSGVIQNQILKFDGTNWTAQNETTGGQVNAIVAGSGIYVDSTDAANPIVGISDNDITDLSLHSVTELNDVTDSGSGKIITDTERTKLGNIEDGAEVNVQSNWDETDTNSDTFILNKPTDITDLSTHYSTELNDITDAGSGKIITDNERSSIGNAVKLQGVDLDATTVGSPQDNQVITYTGGKWQADFASAPNLSGYVKTTDSINVLADVDTETNTPEVGQTLMWDGTNWVSATYTQTSAITIQDPLADDSIPIGIMDQDVYFEKILIYTDNCDITFNINNLFDSDVYVNGYLAVEPDNPIVNAGSLIRYTASAANIIDTGIISYVNVTLVFKIQG